jgi:hypothetical protein
VPAFDVAVYDEWLYAKGTDGLWSIPVGEILD